MAAQRDIDRMIDKYRIHRQARAGDPLVVDERTRERLMSVVEDQYGSSGFVSSQEAAEKYAESLAWQKGIERWWHRMVPWIGFAGVCCLALVVIFVAANYDKDPKQTLVKGPDVMESVKDRSKATSAPAPAAAPQPADLKSSGARAEDDTATGAIAPASTAPAPKTAPRPSPKPAPSPAIVIQAPLPDPSAPMAEQRDEARAASVATAPRMSSGSSTVNSKLDAETTPASALVPVSRDARAMKKAPAKKVAPKRAANIPIESLPTPERPAAQTVSPIGLDSAPVMSETVTDSGARSAKAAPRASRDRSSTPLPPRTPIVWEAPKGGAAPGNLAARRSLVVSAPASTPRMQKFRSLGPGLYLRKPDASTGFAVMSEFDLLTSGSRVTIKDADGSIYNGRVSSAQASGFAFRATGVNRSISQRVEFTGRYAPTLSAADDAKQGTTGASLEGEIRVGGRQPGRLTARRIR